LSVGLQEFRGFALASVLLPARYGPSSAFRAIAPLRKAVLSAICGSDRCTDSTQTFRIGWSGGDTLELINDATGLFAENPAGGRDRLAAGGPHGRFSLTRAANDICAP
jgi:hypothetical protein